MNSHSAHWGHGRIAWVVLLVSALLVRERLVRADPAHDPRTADTTAQTDVLISAQRFDRRALDHVLVPKFVEAHAALSPVIDQVGRWRDSVCPQTSGLTPVYNEWVSRRLVEVAKSVGAPVKADAKCKVNVEVVFTAAPQTFLNHLAKDYPHVLGFYKAEQPLQATTFSRPVQVWYRTVTRTTSGMTQPIMGLPLYGEALDAPLKIDAEAVDLVPPNANNLQVDGEYAVTPSTAPTGVAQSRLSASLRSEFLHVMVIVDTQAVSAFPMRAVADYIGVLALTRLVSLDTCSELPSIVDLFSTDCGSRAKPGSITAADTAFLRALYASDLEQNLSTERADMHDHMMAFLGSR